MVVPTGITAASAAPTAPPPFGPVLSGELFAYAPGRVAFESSPTPARTNNKCILLGGLSDGLMPVPYTSALCCENNNLSLVQPILSSSYTGFGHGRLDRDVHELDELLAYLLAYRRTTNSSNDDSTKDEPLLALVGHSTGCQDIVHYLQHGRSDLVARVRVVALQAPVSDRESATLCHGCHETLDEHKAALEANLQHARQLCDSAGSGGDEMMPRAAFWAPITAQRYLDLLDRNGLDDYFSSDLTDDELRERLGHVSTKSLQACLVAGSGADEYVPATVAIEPLLHRLCRAMNNNSGNDDDDDDDNDADSNNKVAVPLYLPTGNHNLSSRNGADAAIFVAKVQELLASAAAATTTIGSHHL